MKYEVTMTLPQEERQDADAILNLVREFQPDKQASILEFLRGVSDRSKQRTAAKTAVFSFALSPKIGQ